MIFNETTGAFKDRNDIMNLEYSTFWEGTISEGIVTCSHDFSSYSLLLLGFDLNAVVHCLCARKNASGVWEAQSISSSTFNDFSASSISVGGTLKWHAYTGLIGSPSNFTPTVTAYRAR